MEISDYFALVRSSGILESDVREPSTIDEAYRIQKCNSLLGNGSAGWKLGGTNPCTRGIFNTNEPYYGPIPKEGVILSGNKIELLEQMDNVAGEAEVCFKLSQHVECLGNLDLNKVDIDLFIEAVLPSIELPWSAFPLPDAGLKVLIADSCAAGALILGNAVSWDAEMRTKLSGAVSIRTQYRTLAEGVVENIIGGPLQALKDFLFLAKKHDLKLESGQYVATGGCTSCVSLPKGEFICVEFDNFDEFSFFLDQ